MKAFRDLKAPDPSCASAPVLVQSGSRARISRENLVFKPSSWWKRLAEHDTLEETLGLSQVPYFWSKVQSEDPKLYRHPTLKIKRWQRLLCPLLLHGHASPHRSRGSRIVYSISPTSVDERSLLLAAALQACRCAETKCEQLGLPFPGGHLGRDWSRAGQGFQLLVC